VAGAGLVIALHWVGSDAAMRNSSVGQMSAYRRTVGMTIHFAPFSLAV